MLRHPDIDPALFRIGTFQIRWYALFYILSFVLGYFLYRRALRKQGVQLPPEKYESLIFWIILGVIFGGRLGYVIFYNPLRYLRNPLEIFWPFSDGAFTGLQGMSFHGGALGVIICAAIFCWRNKYRFFRIADPGMAFVAIGLGLGRIGNFINGELYGRITSVSWGMLFPYADPVPLAADRTIQVLKELGWRIAENGRYVIDAAGKIHTDLISHGGEMINLPRHPSQLYESLLEGPLLALLSWLILRGRFREGTVFWSFIGFYGVFRFLVEYVRQPDAHLGTVLWGFTMGQILSSFMILAGITGILFFTQRPKPEAISDDTATS